MRYAIGGWPGSKLDSSLNVPGRVSDGLVGRHRPTGLIKLFWVGRSNGPTRVFAALRAAVTDRPKSQILPKFCRAVRGSGEWVGRSNGPTRIFAALRAAVGRSVELTESESEKSRWTGRSVGDVQRTIYFAPPHLKCRIPARFLNNVYDSYYLVRTTCRTNLYILTDEVKGHTAAVLEKLGF